LNVFNLGVVNTSHSDAKGDDKVDPKDCLFAHVYNEGLGKKGTSNVASLILKTLHHLGWMQERKK
jgi:hypothetical protein